MRTDRINRVLDKILMPFTESLWWFVLFFLLTTFPDVWFYCTNQMVNCAFYCAIWNFVLTYVLVLFISLLQLKWIRRTIFVIVLVAVVAMAGVDFVSVFTHQSKFNDRIASSIILTNPDEMAEFWQWGVSQSAIDAIFIALLVLVVLHGAIRKFDPGSHKWFRVMMGSLLVSCLLVCIVRPMTYDQSYIEKIKIWEASFENLTPDLNAYAITPELEYTDSTFETDDDFKLVFIIGESLSATHIPFYGYDKNTMPLLSKRIAAGNMVYFKNVVAPATYTAQAFTLFMTDKESHDGASKWWEHIKMTDVFRTAGYKMNWISNQGKNSTRADGAQVAFSKLCDNAIFTIEKENVDKTERCEYSITGDECIFPYLKDLHEADTTGRTVYFINLFGCHHQFSNRYPPEYAHFSAKDYLNRLESQRQKLSEYDNAVYYNDFVVDSIIEEFADDDALIVYFSDHGLDIYATRPDYAFNGIDSDPESVRVAKKVPLVIAMTRKYRQNHPATAARIARSKVDGFETTNAIYLFMDVCGLRFADNDKVAEYSPLQVGDLQ